MSWISRLKVLVKNRQKKKRVARAFRGATLGCDILAEKGLYVKNPQHCIVGDKCYFGPGCRIEAWDSYQGDTFTPEIIFGKDVRINSTCHIGSINRVKIGDQTLLGSHVMIIDHSHGKNSPEELSIHPSERRLYSKGEVVVGSRCWLCENSVILPGVHIGDESIVAANAVVTKDVPARCVVAGNPATVVKRI